jgi:hypothetical protein
MVLENFGAELTDAAYPVVLQYGVVDNWLDLRLDLWKALSNTVKKWDQKTPTSGVMPAGSLLAAMKAKLEQLARLGVRLSASVVLGAVAGALYAALVSGVHFAVYERWNQIPAFAKGCILVGAVLGLLRGTVRLYRRAGKGDAPAP